MNKSSDLEIIKQLEKELDVTLEKIEMGEIEEKIRRDRIINAYALDEEGRVKGLGLDNLRLSEPQIKLVSQLRFLELASFADTHLKDYSFLSSLTQLIYLDLRGNKLTDVSFLSSLTKLTYLDLCWNHSIKDYSFLSSLTKLTYLNLAGNELTDVSFLSSLTKLTYLDLRYNKLTDISFLLSLTKLTYLDLSVNHSIKDYSFLSSITQLTYLDLRYNKLIDVSFLSSMTQLTNLNLSENQSIKDYSFLSSLTQLTYLNLGGNDLKDVSFLSSLTQLTYLNLERNPIRNPPPEIINKGIEAIRNFFKQMDEQGKARLYEARLLLVGEPGAGKTTLLKKILNPDYQVPNKEEESTLGIEINSEWNFVYSHDKTITFNTNIWDFGGQHIQYMLHQYFLSSRSLYILVSDDRKQRTRFDYWFDIIKVLGEKSPVLVVLNEINHQSISDFDHDKYKKRYSTSYDIEKRDVDFSIDDGRFYALVNKIKEMLSNLKHIGDELPLQWVHIRKKLESIKDENQIGIGRYFDICHENEITQEPDMLTLCGYLTALGVVLHYKDDRALEDTIFVNPYWIVDALYTAISDKTLEVNKGRFNKEWLFKLWEKKGYTFDERCKLLNLMLKDNFEICYRVAKDKDKKEEYMVPLLLPDVEPDYTPLPETNTLKFRFQYPFIPDGIISRLIVRLNEDIEKHEKQDLIWKKGFILKRDGIRARVVEDRSEKGLPIIDIKVSGEEGRRRDFLVVIKNEIHNIHKKSFKDIDYEEMVPCKCSQCTKAGIPHYYEYSVLERYWLKNKSTITCPLSVENVDIWKLIEEVVPSEEARQGDQVSLEELQGWPRVSARWPRAPKKAISIEPIPQEDDKIKQIKEIEDKIKEKREQLQTAENKKEGYDRMAERKANRSSWLFVVFNTILLLVWTVLIFGVFDWTKIEKWTFLIGGGGIWLVINSLYFAIFKRTLNPEKIRAIRLEKEKNRLYKLHEVNINIINRLQSELQQLESRKEELLKVP